VDVKFQLGDVVATKSEGPPAVGTIVAAYNPDFYSWAQNEKIKDIKFTKQRFTTDEVYYSVYFNSGIRVVTVDEIMKEFGWKRGEAEEYVETLSLHKNLDYPESCLELL
jgi:hypothetical protein